MSRYQLLPPLSDAEYAALREDIRAAGVRVPIDVDEDGNILDGHHRKKIADELGVECPERVVRDLPEFAKVDYALTVNLTRRHLDKEGRKALVTRSLKRDPRLSDREHARRCGVSHTYVSGVREALEAAEQLATSASRVGKDGRERPVPADTKPAADRVDPADTKDPSHRGGFSGEEPRALPGHDVRPAGSGVGAPGPATTDPGVAAPAGSEPSSPEPGPFAAGGEREEASRLTPDGASFRVPPAKWTAEERAKHEEEVQLRKDVESARATAPNLVTNVRAVVFTILAGYRLGERHLVTAGQIAECRRALDLLEKEVIADAQR